MKARNQYMVSVMNRYLEKYKDSLELLGYRAGKIDWVYRCPIEKALMIQCMVTYNYPSPCTLAVSTLLLGI
jgi:hypothetical protein